MKRTFPRPQWFILYLLTSLYLGAFWLQLKGGFSEAGHIWVEAGLTCIYFGLVIAWLNANEQAMWLEEHEKREISRQTSLFQTPRLSEHDKRPVSTSNGDSREGPSILQRSSRILPAWLIAVVSHLGDLFQGLR
jgi:hypothetical protein